jgi:hypothetical protein
MLTGALVLEAAFWARRCRLPRDLCARFLHKFHCGEDIADAPRIDVEGEAALLLAYDYALLARAGVARLDRTQLEMLLVCCLDDGDKAPLGDETQLALAVVTIELLWCDLCRGARATAELLAPDRALYDRWRAKLSQK